MGDKDKVPTKKTPLPISNFKCRLKEEFVDELLRRKMKVKRLNTALRKLRRMR